MYVPKCRDQDPTIIRNMLEKHIRYGRKCEYGRKKYREKRANEIDKWLNRNSVTRKTRKDQLSPDTNM